VEGTTGREGDLGDRAGYAQPLSSSFHHFRYVSMLVRGRTIILRGRGCNDPAGHFESNSPDPLFTASSISISAIVTCWEVSFWFLECFGTLSPYNQSLSLRILTVVGTVRRRLQNGVSLVLLAPFGNFWT